MKVINQITGEVITFTNTDTRNGFVFYDYQFDKKSPIEPKSIPFTLSNNSKVTLCNTIWDELKELPEWLDYTISDNYVDWASDLLDRNYRIYFTYKQIAKLTEIAPEFIARKDIEGTTLAHREFDSKGYYVYLTQFEAGDPWKLCYLFGEDFSSEFECNPTRTVDPIDFSPTAEQQALIDAMLANQNGGE